MQNSWDYEYKQGGKSDIQQSELGASMDSTSNFSPSGNGVSQ